MKNNSNDLSQKVFDCQQKIKELEEDSWINPCELTVKAKSFLEKHDFYLDNETSQNYGLRSRVTQIWKQREKC